MFTITKKNPNAFMSIYWNNCKMRRKLKSFNF